MKLTKAQKQALLSATINQDWCLRVNRRCMDSLVHKKLAKFTSGFGYKFGGIIELTSKGIAERERLSKTP